MAERIGYKKTDNDGKLKVQIFYEKTNAMASIDEKFLDIIKRGDDRTADPENQPCAFLTGLIIDPKEYRLRLVNTHHLIKSGYMVCDVSNEHENSDYSQIYLTKVSTAIQDLDLPTRVGYVLEHVIHSDPLSSFNSKDRGRGSHSSSGPTTRLIPEKRSQEPLSRFS